MKTQINGTDILLYSGITSEVVHNVLIGLPATSGSADNAHNTGALQSFTLAIPKGDTHEWTSRIVEFFGSKYRTVGYPLQGIEENIPLCWHKQISVQRLDITGSVTIYEKESFTRHVIDNVHYEDARGVIVNIGGSKVKGAFTAQIIADRYRTDSYRPQIGDIITPGECSFIFDTSSELSASESMQDFRNSQTFAVIGSVSQIKYGEIPDYEIEAQ